MDKKPNIITRMIAQYKDNRMARILLATVLLIIWILILEVNR